MFGETMPAEVERVASAIVDSAYKVHLKFGPGLLESVYEACLAHELRRRGFSVERQVPVPIVYDDEVLDEGFRLDLRVIRLVIVEIKAAPDREMIFQAADYWRKIELQRRRGNLKKARIFGDMEISDNPPLVYLVAPTLGYHRDYAFLARTISPEIEFYRFDLNENWRENLKVLERKGN